MQKILKRKNHEFLEKMLFCDKSSLLTGYVQYQRIDFNNGYSMSIQASEYMYCSPRTTISKENYTEFEIACFDNYERGISVFPNRIDWERNISDIKHKKFNYLIQIQDRFSIAGYVPKDLVEEVFQYLKQLPRRRILIEKSNNLITT